MTDRTVDMRPLARSLKRDISTVHRKAFSRRPVGQMRRLGPAVLRGDVYRVGKSTLIYGSGIPYAAAYNSWRRKNRAGGPLMKKAATRRAVRDALGPWIKDGKK